MFKIVLIGISAVRKSNLLSRFCRNEFDNNYKASIDFEFQTQVVEIDGKECKGEMKKDEDISGAKFALYGCSKLEDMK